jgi:hypothetical protein
MDKESNRGIRFIHAGTTVIYNNRFKAEAMDRLLQFLYLGDYGLELACATSPDSDSDLDGIIALAANSLNAVFEETSLPLAKQYLAHVEVYAIAEHYHLPKLQELAAIKLVDVSDDEVAALTTEDVLQIVFSVYANSSEQDHGLRTLLRRLLADCKEVSTGSLM